ncbi:jg6838 [Pararge aegeria aegeria]|uniref:Jg6838 protein n=1 Tax=Pararge aegeria aegeria TaxID=348720 RepID=A0A8S4RLA3_9NEOP|nr:jg6838 [Pararge aegeria aegeria]
MDQAYTPPDGKSKPTNKDILSRACKELVLQHAALCPSTLGVDAKPQLPVTSPATTLFRPEQSLATMLLRGRNKHGNPGTSSVKKLGRENDGNI